VASSLLLSVGFTPVVQGQIVPDATLPNNSIVSADGNIMTIEGGTTAGGNLFHSFSEFSVPTGREAFFNNAVNIDNILTRVTGGNISNIEGLIRANGEANLFLINPSGIIFGPNARLDIGGSFFGTTANSIVFGNGVEFSATDPEARPLLTVKVPMGLQYGSNPGAILVRGSGHQLIAEHPTLASIDNSSNPGSGLQVKPGQTIALLGGDIKLIGGQIAVTSGQVELASVTSGVVLLRSENTGWNFNYDGVRNFGDIDLSQRSLLDASGFLGGGSIQLSGRAVRLTEGSLAWIQNQSPQASGAIRVRAQDSLFISDLLSDINIASGLFNETVSLGAGGNITVATSQLTLTKGGSIAVRTFTSAPGGDLTVDASESINVIGFAFRDSSIRTNLSTLTFGSGDAGEMTLSTRQLTMVDEALLFGATFGPGDGGDMTVNATSSVELLGSISTNNLNPVISTSSFNEGDASNIIVNARQLRLLNGGEISSSSFASGTAGTIQVNASEQIEISGRSVVTNIPSKIVTTSEIFDDPGLREIFGLSDLPPDGEAGSIILSTSRLHADSGEIAVSNLGTGDAGELQIQANSILLDNQGTISASTRFGEGGNINLQLSENLQMRRDSFISAEAGGMGNSGNITIDTETLALLEDSSISANAIEGAGGNVLITVEGIFVSPDSSITATSELGLDGVVEIINPNVDTTSGLVKLPENVVNPSNQLSPGCAAAVGSSFTVYGRGGLPPNPEQPLTGDRPWTDLRDLSVFRGEVANNSSSEQKKSDRPLLVEANAWIVHPDGTVELVAVVGNSRPQDLGNNCTARQLQSYQTNP